MIYLQLVYIISCVAVGIIVTREVWLEGELTIDSLFRCLISIFLPLLNTLLLVLSLTVFMRSIADKYKDKTIWKKK